MLALIAAAPITCAAQLSGSVAAVSDYRYRGVSLSDDRPALQGTLAYDGPHGVYGGIFASTAKLADAHAVGENVIAYGGYAATPAIDWSCDAGAQFSTFFNGHEYDYGELYAGLSWRRASAHVHFAPRYFGMSRATLYADIDASQVVRETVQLAVHAGVLWPLTHPAAEYAMAERPVVDVRASIGTSVSELELQLWWSDRFGNDNGYGPGSPGHRSTFGVSASHAF